MTIEQHFNPFKGLYYYEETDEKKFFGRDDSKIELYRLVTLNVLTLLLGKSGIGKTSLLNAGLFPLLRKECFLPVRIWFDYSNFKTALIDQIMQCLQKELLQNRVNIYKKGGNEVASSFSKEETLWEYFHRVDHVTEDKKIIIPVLVFDQFEEFFTIGKRHPQRDLLIDELNDLIEDQIPLRVKERILSHVGVFPYLRSQIAVRVIFGLREDYLPQMNTLKRIIPSIHRVMFRVIHLNGIQAKEVMDRTMAFTNEEIKHDILRQFETVELGPGQMVTVDKLEVEPALLSLLCYEVYELGIESLSMRDKDAILSDFYDRVLSQLQHGIDLGQWIEEHLLTEGGYRTPFYLEHNFELREMVEAAIDKKLLRKLHIGEKDHVEIIHDVLAPVIKESRNRRVEKKKRLEIERELRGKKLIIGIISLACIIAIILAIISVIQKNRADEQYKNATSLRLAWESSLTLPIDNYRAIRLAEAAYKIGAPYPAPVVMQTLSAATFTTWERPFFIVSFNHEKGVKTAIFSPDSKRILTASWDGTAKLWNPDGNLLADFKGHRDVVNSAVFSPDGKHVLTASADKTAKLWDLKGNLLANFIGHSNWVTRAVFSPDGKLILTASADGTAKLWGLTGILLADYKGHKADVTSSVFSPNGEMVLTSSIDKTAKIWNLNGKLIADFKGHTDAINSAVFSPDSKWVLTTSADSTAKLWDIYGNLQTEFKGHQSNVFSGVFSPDGAQVLTASLDKTAKIWDLKGRLLSDFKGHLEAIYSAVFSPDGKRILTASYDKTAKLWDLYGELLADCKGHQSDVNRAVFSPDGKRILTASLDNTAKIWNLGGNLVTIFKGHRTKVRSMAFSPDSSRILTASDDNTAKLWNLRGEILSDFRGHTSFVNVAIFSPDGNNVLTASQDNSIKIWDLNGKLLSNFWGYISNIKSVVFSPDGCRILTAYTDGTIKLLDLKGNLLTDFKGYSGIIYSAGFSPGGDRILTAHDDQTLKLWDLKGNHLSDFKGYTGTIFDTVFSIDSGLVLTACQDNTVKIWNLTGKLIADFKGNNVVKNAVFSPDGKRVLTTHNDQGVKLWDLKGQLLADLSGYMNDITCMVFSPDGKKIAMASYEGMVIIFPTPEGIMDWLKSAPIPELTEEDKKKLDISDLIFE